MTFLMRTSNQSSPPPTAEQLERRYRLVAQAGGIDAWEWDINTGRMYLGPVLRQMLGYDDGELADHFDDWNELFHPADRARAAVRLRAHLKGKTPRFEFEHRVLPKKGDALWVRTQGEAERDNSGKPISMYGTCQNISQRVENEAAIRRERQRPFTLLDRLPALVGLMKKDRRFMFTNTLFTELFGAPAGRSCEEIFQGCSQNCGACPAMDTIVTNATSIWEMYFKKKNKHLQLFSYPFPDPGGDPMALIYGVDITHHKNAEAALKSSEERYRSITENMAQGIAVVEPCDPRQSHTDETESRECAMSITSANPIIGEWRPDLDLSAAPRVRDVFPPLCKSQEDVLSPLQQAFSLGKVVVAAFESAHPEDESVQTFRATLSPVFLTPDTVSSVIIVIEDVSAYRQVREQLQQAQKLEAMGALAGGIAHEINQPLNALKLYVSGLQMLLEQSGVMDMGTLATRLSWIMKETEKISEIITHMRTLVQQDNRPDIGVVDINATVHRALSLVTAQLTSHGIQVRLDLAAGRLEAKANSVQLEQVLINLVVNAMQALDTLDSTEQPDKTITIETTRKDNTVELLVADNGPGLSGDPEQIFTPFYTSKDPGKGMGLGLSIVHTFVTSWGGVIEAAPNLKVGARFMVKLQAVDGQASRPPDSAPA